MRLSQKRINQDIAVSVFHKKLGYSPEDALALAKSIDFETTTVSPLANMPYWISEQRAGELVLNVCTGLGRATEGVEREIDDDWVCYLDEVYEQELRALLGQILREHLLTDEQRDESDGLPDHATIDDITECLIEVLEWPDLDAICADLEKQVAESEDDRPAGDLLQLFEG